MYNYFSTAVGRARRFPKARMTNNVLYCPSGRIPDLTASPKAIAVVEGPLRSLRSSSASAKRLGRALRVCEIEPRQPGWGRMSPSASSAANSSVPCMGWPLSTRTRPIQMRSAGGLLYSVGLQVSKWTKAFSNEEDSIRHAILAGCLCSSIWMSRIW